MTSELLTRLAERGCAVQDRLDETFMGNEALYEKLLRRLAASDTIARMTDAFAVGDVETLFSASHELKGLYATLGLTPLFVMCSDIVEIARTGTLEGIGQKLSDLRTGHNEFLELIGG
ncbi:MAG: Hpt domain-containing protein [Kiritimatiellae bacterium]|nr:Hpt domain-containing protein [Kiritimatiellia bacterium]